MKKIFLTLMFTAFVAVGLMSCGQSCGNCETEVVECDTLVDETDTLSVDSVVEVVEDTAISE